MKFDYDAVLAQLGRYGLLSTIHTYGDFESTPIKKVMVTYCNNEQCNKRCNNKLGREIFRHEVDKATTCPRCNSSKYLASFTRVIKSE